MCIQSGLCSGQFFSPVYVAQTFLLRQNLSLAAPISYIWIKTFGTDGAKELATVIRYTFYIYLCTGCLKKRSLGFFAPKTRKNGLKMAPSR